MTFASRLAAALESDAAALAALADPDARVRRVAVGHLARGQHREAVLSRATGDADPLVRAAAIDAWGAAGDAPADVLRTGLGDGHDLVAEAAALALGACGGPAAVPLLLDALAAHDSDLVRESAAAALGEIGDPGAIDGLLRAASTGRPPVRRRALLALSVFDDARARDAIATARTARNPAVREIAEQLADPGA